MWTAGEGIKVYINGVLDNELVDPTLESFTTTNSEFIGIGKLDELPGPRQEFHGDIDEVEVFSRALSTAEIQGIFEAGSTGKCKEVADLSLTKSDDADPIAAGEQLIYTVEITNNGPSLATGDTVTDTLPAGVTFDAGSSSAECSETAGIVTCNIGDLAVDESMQVSIVVDVNFSTVGPITNEVSVIGDQTDPDDTNDSDTEDTEVMPFLTITKSDDPDPVTPGGDITYTITVTNNSATETATTVLIFDTLPLETSFASSPSGNCFPSGRNILCLVGDGNTMDRGETVVSTIVAKVDPSTVDGSITNTAAVTSNQAGAIVVTEDTEVVTTADLSLTKIVDNDAPNEVDTIVYAITVSNGGLNDATNVEVTDQLPDGVSYVSDGGGGSYSISTGIWIVGTVANGTSTTLNITATVDTGTGGGTITNDAVVTAVDQVDPDPTNNSASVDIAVIPASCTLDLTLTYTDGTLIMDFELGTSEPALWKIWLVAVGQVIPVMSIPVPVIDPPTPINITVPFPSIGKVGILTALLTSEGVECGDFGTVDTGAPSSAVPSISELQGLLPEPSEVLLNEH